MLRSIKQIYGNKLGASDGEIGRVKDFYFDDQSWAVRYLVADTGSWLTGRQVLLSPHSLGRLAQAGTVLRVNLTRKQIEESPSIESHKPVSRQFEEEYHGYYGWPAYWNGAEMRGVSGGPVVVPPVELAAEHARESTADFHLRSAKALTGYRIETVDGPIGHVSGFLLNDKSWVISDLVVDAGTWFSGKEILISPSKIESVSCEESKVYVKLTKADIQHTGEDQLARAGSESVGTEYFSD